jgi:PA14 domain-containing protein
VGTPAPGFYEYSFTVPYGLTTLTIGAIAEDLAGNVATAQSVVVSVAPDPLTTVQGTVVDDTGAPVAGAQVVVTFGGLKGEFFNFDTPLTEMPDLTGRAPDGVRRVSAVNFRNPDNVLSPDTFGVSLAPHYAARFVGQIDIPAPGTYTFTLGADDGARLIIRGAEVVTVNGTADFTEASNAVNLPAGRHPIEIQYFQNTGDAELRLSYSRFGGIQEIVPPARLFGGDGGDFRAVTNDLGAFSIAGVPTILGNLSIGASATVADQQLSGGVSGLTPVSAGTTDAGAIIVTALQFETNLGQFVASCDDCNVPRDLPFPFTFFGQTYTRVFVNSNGNLTFGSGDNTFTESLAWFLGLPRLSAFWDDLIYGGIYVNDQIPGRFVVTWNHVQEFCCYGDSTIQMTLFSDGRIAFIYNGLTARDAIVGISPGGGSTTTLQQVDFSAGPVTSNPGTAVAEQFAANPFDLDRHFLVVTPKPAGGYDFVVRPLSPPPSGIPASAFMVPGARLELWPPSSPR